MTESIITIISIVLVPILLIAFVDIRILSPSGIYSGRSRLTTLGAMIGVLCIPQAIKTILMWIVRVCNVL